MTLLIEFQFVFFDLMVIRVGVVHAIARRHEVIFIIHRFIGHLVKVVIIVLLTQACIVFNQILDLLVLRLRVVATHIFILRYLIILEP